MISLYKTFHTFLHPVLIFCLLWTAISLKVCDLQAWKQPAEPQMSTPELKGWHSRALAHPHPDPHSFTPYRADLELVMLKSSMLDPEGFILAIFSSKDDDNEQYVVVDALGRVLLLPGTSTDIISLLELGRRVSDLPPLTGRSWRILHEITCLPIFNLFVAMDSLGGPDQRKLTETNVYGYSHSWTKLEEEVNGQTHLPNAIQEVFGLALEADKSPPGIGSGDRFVIDKVMEALWH